jgi:hypothetical protein
MPILKNEKVEAGKIAKDDVVKGRAAAIVKMILRAPLRQIVAILRPTPTEEEVAAQKAEREAQQREWREEAISSWLANTDDRYAGAVGKFSEAVAGGWAPQNYWDQYTDLAKAQAEHRIAKEVEHVIARSAERSAFDPMDACDAYDAWRDQARVELVDRGFSGESRSTNQFSNLLEAVYHAAVARHVSQDGRYFL